MAKIIKQSDDVFNGNHPNNINEGYQTTSFGWEKPELPVIGQGYNFGILRTSTVTEIISQDDEGYIFKTVNSTYKVTY